MFGVLLVLGAVAAAVATPPYARSRQDIESFKQFLESTLVDDGLNAFMEVTDEFSPSNPEESGKFEGDIVLDSAMVEAMVLEYAAGRNAYTWPETKWPNDTVVWEFGEDEFDSEQMAAIEEGIADIANHTCIKFRRRAPEDTNYVKLTGASGGCFANVGFKASRGAHTLNLARNTPGAGCFRHATIVHEFLHILGFYHMQSTYNRDQYVRIVVENVRPGKEHNFEIRTSDRVSNLGVEYDYVSCMHYGPLAFSANSEPTIVALQKHEGTMGQRVVVTEKDWLRANRQYNCPGAWD